MEYRLPDERDEMSAGSRRLHRNPEDGKAVQFAGNVSRRNRTSAHQP